METQDQTVVSAVAIASRSGGVVNPLSMRIQAAMASAVLIANAHGISTAEENSPFLRECMEVARRAVKNNEDSTQVVVDLIRSRDKV